ncbi:unnamed protein product, partial [Phaeothamnion confervicola]
METTHKPLLVLRTKVVIVGDAYVGKTALTQMFHSGGVNYPKNYIMTIGVEFCVRQVNITAPNDPAAAAAAVELFLFDTAGQSIFNKLDQSARYWESASFACVVFDVSSRSSFE